MPTRSVTIREALREGEGNMTVTETGGLRYGQPIPPGMPTFTRTSSTGVTSKFTLPPGALPNCANGERATLTVLEIAEAAGRVLGIAQMPIIVSTDVNGVPLGNFESGKIRVYSANGALLFTNIAEEIEEAPYNEQYKVAGDAQRFNEQLTRDSGKQAQPAYSREVQMIDSGIIDAKGVRLSHKPTGVAVAKSPTGYSPKTWNAQPLSVGSSITLETPGASRLSIRSILFTGTDGKLYRATLGAVPFTPSGSDSIGRFDFHWKTNPITMPFARMTNIQTVRVAYNELSGTTPVAGTRASISVSYEVYGAGGVLLASGANPSFKNAISYRILITGSNDRPIEITAIEATCTTQDVVVTEPPAPTGSGAVFTGAGGSIPSGYFGIAQVSGATQSCRIMRHPLMDPGCHAVNQAGQLCSWESPSFLRLPGGTTSVSWKAGRGAITLSPAPHLPTLLGWGDVTVQATNTPSSEMESNFGTPGTMRTYTPDVKVMVAGLDATLDLVSAGGLSASFQSDMHEIAGPPPQIEGNDFEIWLDGVRIEWGKVVSYNVRNSEEGTQIEVSAIDPLDYHNVDVESLYNNYQDVPAPEKDLQAFALSIANHAGLTLSGLGTMDLPTNMGADTEGDDPYTVYGSTVTQELELVANAGLCTVVTDVPTKTIRFMPLAELTESRASSPPDPNTCAFVGMGYNLADGYGLVSVSGVSNTVRVVTKLQDVTFIRLGTNGMENDSGIKILKHSGNGSAFGNDQDVSGYWPDSGIPEAIDNALGKWVEFQKVGEQGGGILMPVPLRTNLEGQEVSKQERDAILEKYKNGGVIKYEDGVKNGAPILKYKVDSGKDPRKVYWIEKTVGLDLFGQGPMYNWKEEEEHSGYFYIKDIEFLVETPAQIHARYPTMKDTLPESFGPCITAMRVYIKDEGLYGYSVYFRLAFQAHLYDETSISVLPFVCPPDGDIISAGKLPHKKVNVQNPFIVQERPKEGTIGAPPDLLSSPAYQRGVALANSLTRWEAIKRYSGEVKVLGGKLGRIGDVIEGQRIIGPAQAQIVPGDACWTIFKTSSYGG